MSLDRDYDILILSRLIPLLPGPSPEISHSPQTSATTPSSNPPSISSINLHDKSRALLERVKESCTTPGNECFLSDLRVGLPAFCAYLASSDAEGPEAGGVTLEKAQIEACLTRQDFIRGVGIVARAAGMELPVIPPQPQPKAKPSTVATPPTVTPVTHTWKPRSSALSQPSTSSGSQANTNGLLSPLTSVPRSLSHTQIIRTQRTTGAYGYNILEPLFATRSTMTQAPGAMASLEAPVPLVKTPDTIPQDQAQSASANTSGARPNGGERPKKRRRTEGAVSNSMSGMQETRALEEENVQLRHRINSLQHLLHRERFDREERDIEEHHELTVLRTALVKLLDPSMMRPSSIASTSTARVSPLASTSLSNHTNVSTTTNGKALIETAADAIGAVEKMARRRLIITDLPDVETYDFEDQEDKQPEDDEQSLDDDEQSLDDDVRMDDEPTAGDGPAADVVEGGKKAQKRKKKKKEKEARQQSEASSDEDPMTAAIFEDGDVPEAGTMVWARLPSHPWYPAVVYDEGPVNVMESRPRSKDKNYCLVNFFDERKSWAWLLLPPASSRLRMFGYSDVLDEDMVAEESKLQATQHVGRKAASGGKRGGGGRWGKKEREKVLTAVRAATENMAPEEDD